MMSVKDEADPEDPKPKPVLVYRNLYWILLALTFIVYAIFLIIAAKTWRTEIISGLNVGFPFFAMILIHIALSLGFVDTNQWAGLFFYGKPLKLLGLGPYFRPFGLMQVKKESRKLQQFQAPGEPEEIFHGDDKLPLPPGKVRPIRVTTRAARPGETGHLDVQMTVSWSFYVQFQILRFFEFVSRVEDFEHAKQLIRDTGEAVLNEFASQYTVNGMIENVTLISEELDNRIRILTNSWGIEIFEAKVLSHDLSHELASALRDLPAARLRAEQTKVTADAERERLVQEGIGAATALEAKLVAEAKGEAAMQTALADGREAYLTAEAKGLKAKADLLKVDGEGIIVAEVASDAFKHADSVMVGAGDSVRDLFGMLKAGKSVLGSNGKEKPDA